ncbi:hypothetical protein ES705_46972 [subsurface metagenome]
MSVEELIQEFEHSNKKANDIRNLSDKFNISEREVISTLQRFNIKTPKIVSRSEVVEIGDNEIKKIKAKIKLNDDDVYPAVSVIKKFEDMGWAKKEGIERVIQLSYYIETKLGLDCFKIYSSMLEYIIKNSGVKKLEQDIDSIQNGNRFGITEKPEVRIINALMGATEDLLKGLLEPETEAKPKTKPINEKPLLVSIYEAYNMLKNPEKYKFEQWRKKEANKKEIFNRGLEAVRSALDYE